MKKEFTKEDILELLEKYSIDNKVSLDDLQSVVFDIRFPKDMFEHALGKLIEDRDDEKRYKELANILQPDVQKLLELQKEIVELTTGTDEENYIKIYSLKLEQAEIEKKIAPLEKEFELLNDKINMRHKG